MTLPLSGTPPSENQDHSPDTDKTGYPSQPNSTSIDDTNSESERKVKHVGIVSPRAEVRSAKRSATNPIDTRPIVTGEATAHLNPAIHRLITSAHQPPPGQSFGRSYMNRPVVPSFDDMSPLFRAPLGPYGAHGAPFSVESGAEGAMDDDSTYSLTTTLLNLSSETLNTLVSEPRIGEFLAPDEDLTDDESHLPTNTRSRRRASLPSIMFTDSVTAHPATLPMKDFCDLVDRYPSMERAEIQRVECYQDKAAPKHRFLVFYCARRSKCPVWFRVDRRIEGGVSRLLFSRGTANAKDTVKIAVNKADLFGTTPCEQENQLSFTTYPTLGAFRFFLDIIGQEMKKYELYPQNCWFLCSVLQEHLRKASAGEYTLGGPVVPDYAPGIRFRIQVRVYHETNPLQTSELIHSIRLQNGLASSIFKRIVKLSEKVPDFPPRPEDLLNPAQIKKIKKLADALHDFVNSPNSLAPGVLCLLLARSVGLYRHLYLHNHQEHCSRFSELLLAYAPRLRQCGRYDDALYCYQEALNVQRDQNVHDPDAYSDIFVPHLTQHADRLASARRFTDACTVQLEIVKIHKALYDTHPSQANDFILAGHRRSYVTRLLQAGHPEDACAEVLEIVEMARVFHGFNPSKYATLLADRLHVYAGHLTSLGRLREACQALEEAVELRRGLHNDDPREQMQPFLASLAKYKVSLSRAGRSDDVQAVDHEVLDIHRQAFVRDPHAHWETAAEALRAHIDRLPKDSSELYALKRELVGVYRELYEMEPDTHHGTFCNAVLDNIDWLVLMDRVPEARNALLEIVELHRKLFESDQHRHYGRLAGFLDRYSSLLTDSGKIQNAADVVKEILTIYHNLWKENHSVYFKQVRDAVAIYDTALNSAGYKCEGPSILVDVHRVRHQNSPDMKSARELAESLDMYARRLEEVARWEDASNAALELVDILQKHPLPPRSSEAMARTQQIHACSLHVARARDFEQALSIAKLAMQGAQDIGETGEFSAWVQRWRPKTKRTYDEIQQVVGKKKQTSRIVEAQKLRLTYRDNMQVDEKPPLPRWIVISLLLGIAAAFAAVYVARH